jgi:tetratricopeptide (TPR) repeat protein
MTAALFSNRGRSGIFATLGLVGLLAAASVFVQMERDRRYRTDQPADQILYVRSTETMRRMVLSYDALAADVYWIRAIQHFGTSRMGSQRYDLLYPLLDLATSLDGRFNIAYRFGSLFLAEPPPGGPGRPDLAIELLQKAIKEMPWNWHYYQDAGFVYYFSYKDYAKAAEWFKRGAAIEDAPWFMKVLAANTLSKGGDREASRLLYESILATAENNTFMKDDAEWRLRQLSTLDDLDVLREVIRRYRERVPAGRQVTWQTLIAARILRFVPRDRDGFDFILDPVTGDVRLDPKSTLAPLPTYTPPGEAPPPEGVRPTPPPAAAWPSPIGVPPILDRQAPRGSFPS